MNRGKGVVAELGLRMKAIDIPIGLAVGVASQLLLVPALYWLLFKVIGVKDVSAAARSLTDRATDPLSIVLVFVVVAIGAPLAEEIYFRGLRPADLRAPHPTRVRHPRLGGVLRRHPTCSCCSSRRCSSSAWCSGYMAWRSGRLGPAIWAHVGFNSVTAAALVFHIG